MRLLIILFVVILVSQMSIAQNFVTKWINVTNEVSFYANTSGSVDYTWTGSPSGNSGSGSFNQSNLNTLVTINNLNVSPGDELTLNFSPSNLIRFYNCYENQFGQTFNNPDSYKIVEVSQWGSVQWENFAYTLCNCPSVNITAVDSPNLELAQDATYAFRNTLSLINSLDGWDVSAVTNMRGMFLASGYNNLLTSWDVSNVTSMKEMFYLAENFNQNINNWNVSNVITMEAMFLYTESFNQPLDNWNVSNVTSMKNMFQFAESFNQPIGVWNVSNVTNMFRMFQNAVSFNQPINNWNVSSVVDMSFMFRNNTSFNQNLSTWDVSNVAEMYSMFSGSSSFNQSLNSWDISNVNSFLFFLNGAASYNHNFVNWQLNSNADLFKALDGTAISCENYSTTLEAWANNSSTPNNISLGALNLEYGNNVIGDRNILINSKGWTISGDTPSGFDCNSILPISLVTFSVQNKLNRNHIIFSTISQINNEKFIVEHSSDGISFSTIEEIKGAGNSSVLINYMSIHDRPSYGQNYYRIKQIDYSGMFEYSDVVTVWSDSIHEITIFPNPASDNLHISVPTSEMVMIQIIDGLGRKIIEVKIEKEAAIDITDLEKGVYWIRYGNETIKLLKL